LKPGEAVGTSDLVVETTPTQAVTGNVALDDYGNQFTGRARAGGSVSFNNPLHHGDTLSFNALTSGSGMNYGRIAYDDMLNGLGTHMGGSYSSMNYVLGDTLASSNGNGTAQVGSLWAKHPLERSRDVNLYGQIQYDQMQLRDNLGAIQTYRHINNWTASLTGDERDALLSGAINTWSLSGTSGRVGFDNVAAQAADAVTANTQGSFSKWNANLARLQGLSQNNSLYLTFAAQGTNGNLDSSLKMVVGGPYTVRAYDMGAISGDTGYLLTTEFRHDLGQAWQGQWQAIAFLDTAQVTVNKNVWVAGTNSATLTGAGVGFNWSGLNQWSAKTYIAAPIGSTPVLVGTTPSARAWIELGKGF
jgi:hemolysin activation/secretion protein